MDANPKRIEKDAFSKGSGYVWTGPEIAVRGSVWLTSIIQANCSTSFSPGNIGHPVCNSDRMQPRLHMSMAAVYETPVKINIRLNGELILLCNGLNCLKLDIT